MAVLPFVGPDDDFDAQAFVDGVSDHLTYVLACTRGLFVSGRTSAFTFRERSPVPREIGRILGVANVLEGTLTRRDERIEIGAQLSDTRTGRILWREDFAGTQDTLFQVLGRILTKTVETIAPGLGFDQAAVTRTRLSSDFGIYAKFLSAYSNYVAGSEEGMRHLVGSLGNIARLAPDQPLPPALLAQAYTNLVVQGWSRDIEADTAEGIRYARAALAMEADACPAVLTWAGHALSALGRDHAAALDLLDRSLALNPNSSATHERTGWVRCHVGQPREAAEHFRAARRISPLDSMSYRFESGLGLALCMMDEHAEAVVWLRHAIVNAPTWTSSYRTLAASLAHLGDIDGARAAATSLLQLEPGYTGSDLGCASTRTHRARSWWRRGCGWPGCPIEACSAPSMSVGGGRRGPRPDG